MANSAPAARIAAKTMQLYTNSAFADVAFALDLVGPDPLHARDVRMIGLRPDLIDKDNRNKVLDAIDSRIKIEKKEQDIVARGMVAGAVLGQNEAYKEQQEKIDMLNRAKEQLTKYGADIADIVGDGKEISMAKAHDVGAKTLEIFGAKKYEDLKDVLKIVSQESMVSKSVEVVNGLPDLANSPNRARYLEAMRAEFEHQQKIEKQGTGTLFNSPTVEPAREAQRKLKKMIESNLIETFGHELEASMANTNAAPGTTPATQTVTASSALRVAPVAPGNAGEMDQAAIDKAFLELPKEKWTKQKIDAHWAAVGVDKLPPPMKLVGVLAAIKIGDEKAKALADKKDFQALVAAASAPYVEPGAAGPSLVTGLTASARGKLGNTASETWRQREHSGVRDPAFFGDNDDVTRRVYNALQHTNDPDTNSPYIDPDNSKKYLNPKQMAERWQKFLKDQDLGVNVDINGDLKGDAGLSTRKATQLYLKKNANYTGPTDGSALNGQALEAFRSIMQDPRPQQSPAPPPAAPAPASAPAKGSTVHAGAPAPLASSTEETPAFKIAVDAVTKFGPQYGLTIASLSRDALRQHWNAIKGDELNDPEIQAVGLASAVKFGDKKAAQMLKEANHNPENLIDSYFAEAKQPQEDVAFNKAVVKIGAYDLGKPLPSSEELRQHWSTINGDSLSPDMQAVGLGAAVEFGADKAATMLRSAGNDRNAFLNAMSNERNGRPAPGTPVAAAAADPLADVPHARPDYSPLKKTALTPEQLEAREKFDKEQRDKANRRGDNVTAHVWDLRLQDDLATWRILQSGQPVVSYDFGRNNMENPLTDFTMRDKGFNPINPLDGSRLHISNDETGFASLGRTGLDRRFMTELYSLAKNLKTQGFEGHFLIIDAAHTGDDSPGAGYDPQKHGFGARIAYVDDQKKVHLTGDTPEAKKFYDVMARDIQELGLQGSASDRTLVMSAGVAIPSPTPSAALVAQPPAPPPPPPPAAAVGTPRTVTITPGPPSGSQYSRNQLSAYYANSHAREQPLSGPQYVVGIPLIDVIPSNRFGVSFGQWSWFPRGNGGGGRHNNNPGRGGGHGPHHRG